MNVVEPTLGPTGVRLPGIRLRSPVDTDAIGMRRLAERTGVLDVNSTYAYLLWATDFAATSIVADAPATGALLGYITGYHPPARPEVLFVWQVAVDPAAQGRGLGGAMLDALVARVCADRNGGPVTVEATVAPSNSSSRALFGALARRHGVPITEQPRFGADLLDLDGGHEDEPMLRIGPITRHPNNPERRHQ